MALHRRSHGSNRSGGFRRKQRRKTDRLRSAMTRAEHRRRARTGERRLGTKGARPFAIPRHFLEPLPRMRRK